MDLDIDNYDFPDLLKLFQIPIDFGEGHLKRAKLHVIKMHPDKSGLPKEYFLFFSKAFKILLSIYDFREKAARSDKLDLATQNTDYVKCMDNDHAKQAFVDGLDKADFNGWFNALFEKVKISTEYDQAGYGDWLKTSNEDHCHATNIAEMNREILKKKTALSAFRTGAISEFNNTGFCDLTNAVPTSYGSGLFSTLQYEDLRKAHEESVVPVTDADFKPGFLSLDELRLSRQRQEVHPLNEAEAQRILCNDKRAEDTTNSYRAFKLVKQEREMTKANEQFWTHLLRN